jgi:hypothetical protein
LCHCKYLIRGSSPGFPPNFGGDYGSVTVIVFAALAWRLLKSRFLYNCTPHIDQVTSQIGLVL